MRVQKREKVLFYISLVCFALLAVSFIFMPLDEKLMPQNTQIYNMVMGIWFWLFLVFGIVAQILLIRCYKKSADAQKSNGEIHWKWGIFHFFQNRYAVAADVALGIGLIGLMITYIISDGTSFICYPFITVSVFSFCMHCICNGKTFIYLFNKEPKE